MNTILTVIHALKPNSLTHSLQIYYTGLTDPRFHTPWTWATKCVPTYIISLKEVMKSKWLGLILVNSQIFNFFYGFCVNFCQNEYSD